MRLKISDIRIDGNTQSRVAISQETINEYAEAMKGGDVFPPVTVFKSQQGEYWLADGYHRLYAAKQSGASEIEADVKDGDIYSAIEYAAGANAKHGIRRTNADKRRAVLMLLECPKYQEATTAVIADKVKVSRGLVEATKEEIRQSREVQKSTYEYNQNKQNGEILQLHKELAEMKAALKAEREKPPVTKVEYQHVQVENPETLERLRKAEEESKSKDKRLYEFSHKWQDAEDRAQAELVKAKEAEEKLKAAVAKIEADKQAGKDVKAAQEKLKELCRNIETYSKKCDIERSKLEAVSRSVSVLNDIRVFLLQRKGEVEFMAESDITSWSQFDVRSAQEVAYICHAMGALIEKTVNKSKVEVFVDVESNPV